MENTYLKRSAITGRTYDLFDDDTIVILNPQQSAYYVSMGVSLLDVQLSNDRKTGKPILTYLFKRSETKNAYDAWCKQRDYN